MASLARSFCSYKCSQISTAIATQQSTYETKAIEVENGLRNELRSAFFAETPGFLDTFFPISDEKITEIYNAIGDSLWSGFPKEKARYQPFADFANTIHAACGNDAHHDLRWSSARVRYPLYHDTKATDMQPDIIAALGVPDETKAKSENFSERTKTPWHRILVPIVVKKDGMEAPVQLFKYIRQIFRDTADRRFVFGLVLENCDITIYLADRSGVLGSTSFDIHDVRETFPLYTPLADRIFLHRIIAR